MVSLPTQPARGEIWMADLNPTRGREQAGRRPVLVVSTNMFNQGPAGLVVILPLTTRDKKIPFHIAVEPPEGGLKTRSHIKCDDVRSIDKQRLTSRWGEVSRKTLHEVDQRLRILLEL